MVDVYRGVLKKCDSVSLRKFPHYIVPGHNLHDKVDVENEDGSRDFPYNCMQPLPLLPPSKVSSKVLQGEDPVTVLVKKKLLWKDQVHVYKGHYRTQKKKDMVCQVLQDAISSSKTVHTVSDKDAGYVKLLAGNPDREFDGTYNWYYSGGCLDQLEMGGQVLLLTTGGKRKDQLCVLPLEMENDWQTSLSDGSFIHPTSGHAIHQLRGICKQDKGLIGMRLHNVCHLYSLDPSLHLESVSKATSEHPFTGLDLNRHSHGTYCTVTTRKCVQEWDINAGNPVTSRLPAERKLADKWCSVSYCNDPHMIRMTDRCCSYFLDKRNHIKKASLLLCLKKVPNCLEKCEAISLEFESCLQPHTLYVCTSHHVFLYDIRAGSRPLQRWTHLLCSTPLYGCTVATSSAKELVCIGNQEPGEIVSLLNSWDGEVPYSHVPPFALPNLHDAVHFAHRYGIWLDPFTQQRVQFSLTGLVWLPPQASSLTLLSQTAAGDVFRHILKPRNLLQLSEKNLCCDVKGSSTNKKINVNNSSGMVSDCSEKTDLRCLIKWEQQLLKAKTSSVLKITSRKEMKHVYRRLWSGQHKFHQNTEKKVEKDKWMMSKQEMESYVDIVAPRILAVWNIDEEPEWCEGQTILQEDLSPTSHDKVQAWLTSAASEKHNRPSYERLCEEESSSFSMFHVSEHENRVNKKFKTTLNVLQPRKQSHTPTYNLFEKIHSKKETAASTPLILRNVEGSTQNTFHIPDLQKNDTFMHDIFVSQSQDTCDDLTHMTRTIHQSQELSQDEDCMILNQKHRNMKKKGIKFHNKSAFVTGF